MRKFSSICLKFFPQKKTFSIIVSPLWSKLFQSHHYQTRNKSMLEAVILSSTYFIKVFWNFPKIVWTPWTSQSCVLQIFWPRQNGKYKLPLLLLSHLACRRYLPVAVPPFSTKLIGGGTVGISVRPIWKPRK